MMIRTSKIVHALNWRYALGELTLIVLGILLALAISDWSDQRIQRDQEKALLGEIRTTLEFDLAEFESRLAILQQSVPLIETLSRQLKTNTSYDASMDRLFGAAYGVHGINLNSTAYENLKSVGLQSVSNIELRQGFMQIFDHYYEKISIEREVDMGVTLEVMRPYYLQHFSDLVFLQSATPIDYEQVAGDIYYQNIINYRLAVLRNNQLKSYPEVMAEIHKVLVMLEEELR